MTLGPLLVALLLAARALPARQLLFWWSWSRAWTLVGAGGTLLLLLAVSAGGALAAKATGLTPDPSIAQEAAAGLVAQAVARRAGRTTPPGGTLVLGATTWLREFVNELVADRIREHFRALADEDLIAAGSRLDGLASGARSALKIRIAWRKDIAKKLAAGQDVRDEVREDLVRSLVTGYGKHLLRRPDA